MESSYEDCRRASLLFPAVGPAARREGRDAIAEVPITALILCAARDGRAHLRYHGTNTTGLEMRLRIAVQHVRAIALLSLLTIISAAAGAQGAPFRVGGRSIAIPAPPSSLQETGADYRVLLDVLVPTDNRLVAAYVTPSDLQLMSAGKASSLSQYALVEVPRRAEFTDISADEFRQVVETMGQQFGAILNGTLKDQQDELNRRLKSLDENAATITMDKPVVLGSLFSKQDAAAFGMVVPVTSAGSTTKMAVGLVVLRAQERLIFAYYYSTYRNEGTVATIRTVSEHWADTILAANSQ